MADQITVSEHREVLRAGYAEKSTSWLETLAAAGDRLARLELQRRAYITRCFAAMQAEFDARRPEATRG